MKQSTTFKAFVHTPLTKSTRQSEKKIRVSKEIQKEIDCDI